MINETTKKSPLEHNLFSTSVKGVVRQNYLSVPQHGGAVDCPQLLA